MWKLSKRLVAVAPVLVLVALGVVTYLQRTSLEADLRDPDGLVWESPTTRLEVRVEERRDGTRSTHRIRVVRPDGSVASEIPFEIDWNAGLAGGGFVKAMQADADPELEVAAWASNVASDDESRLPFYLDHKDGKVTRRAFESASPGARELARRWLQVHVVRNLEITALVVLSVVYYIVLGLVVGAIALVRRLRRRSAAGPGTR